MTLAGCEINNIAAAVLLEVLTMLRFARLCSGMLVRLFCAGRSILFENLALRQQVAVLNRRHPRRSPGLFDRLFWIAVAWQVWSAWKQSPVPAKCWLTTDFLS
jgi:hypothetical protein